MRLLLLLGLLTAGAAAHSISRRSLLQLEIMIKCIMPWSNTLFKYKIYGCYCSFWKSGIPVDELDTCCQTHHQCYAQVENLDYCTFPIDHPKTNTYSYYCIKHTVTCSDKNNPCDAFICECDHQHAICISKATYHKEYEFIRC